MRIEFERSGGFAGMRLSVTVDTNTLDAEEAQEMQNLIDEASFFDLPEELECENEADNFTYQVTVEQSEEIRHTVRMKESAAPDELMPLLQRLNLMARTRRRQ
jgi:hypothetical protein